MSIVNTPPRPLPPPTAGTIPAPTPRTRGERIMRTLGLLVIVATGWFWLLASGVVDRRDLIMYACFALIVLLAVGCWWMVRWARRG